MGANHGELEARIRRIFRRRPLIIAHRGYPAKYRENTIASFLAAKELGADMMEIDVRVSADGSLVAIHDPDIHGRPVRSVRDREIRILGIDFVEEIVEALPGDTLFMLDIKDEGSIYALERLISEKSIDDRVVLAGVPRAVEILGKKLALVMAPSFELCDWHETLRRAISMGAHVLNDHYSCYDPQAHREAVKRGIRISTWTVNDPSDIERMAALGVDAIVTDNLVDALKIARKFRRSV
ncbi:MAG: glycerophosphodiester phosphodiesterase [Sulfolobales archaeon]